MAYNILYRIIYKLYIIIPPYNIFSGGWVYYIYWNQVVHLPVCLSICVSHLCLEDFFRTTEPYMQPSLFVYWSSRFCVKRESESKCTQWTCVDCYCICLNSPALFLSAQSLVLSVSLSVALSHSHSVFVSVSSVSLCLCLSLSLPLSPSLSLFHQTYHCPIL